MPPPPDAIPDAASKYRHRVIDTDDRRTDPRWPVATPRVRLVVDSQNQTHVEIDDDRRPILTITPGAALGLATDLLTAVSQDRLTREGT